MVIVWASEIGKDTGSESPSADLSIKAAAESPRSGAGYWIRRERRLGVVVLRLVGGPCRPISDRCSLDSPGPRAIPLSSAFAAGSPPSANPA